MEARWNELLDLLATDATCARWLSPARVAGSAPAPIATRWAVVRWATKPHRSATDR